MSCPEGTDAGRAGLVGLMAIDCVPLRGRLISWQLVLKQRTQGGPKRGTRSRVGQLGPRGLARRMFSEQQRKPGLKAGGLRPQPGGSCSEGRLLAPLGETVARVWVSDFCVCSGRCSSYLVCFSYFYKNPRNGYPYYTHSQGGTC